MSEEPVKKPHGTPMNYTSAAASEAKPVGENGRDPVDKVIAGEIVERKKSLGRKIADTFTGEDAKLAGNHVVFDVILPQFKGLVVDAGTQMLERLILGESSGYRRSSTSAASSPTRARQTSYSSYHRGGADVQRDEPELRVNEIREFVVNTRGEAQEVLDGLFGLLEKYQTVSISDYYDLVGYSSKSRFTDSQWGWFNLNTAGVSRVREGFRIELPRAVSIK